MGLLTVVGCRLMKRESAKHAAEESPRSAATSTKIFRKAKGWMLIRSILIMAFMSNEHAKPKSPPNESVAKQPRRLAADERYFPGRSFPEQGP
jgi:hypothetical protein